MKFKLTNSQDVVLIEKSDGSIIDLTNLRGGVVEGYYINGNFYDNPPIDHDYVEIAGIKWATMNLGAESETGYGLYYQWGDTQGCTAAQVGNGEGQKYFGWADYKYGNGTSSPGAIGMTKYNATDGKTILEASDDAVTDAWGGQWRMPTKDEYVAFGNAVNAVWTTDYQSSGVRGFVCTDKTDSSKVLFFPAAGCCFDGSFYYGGSNGSYWSGSLYGSDVSKAYRMDFISSTVDWLGYGNRYYGRCVRAIYDGPTPTAIIPILGALYIDKVTNVIYRYDGSTYVLLSAAPVSNSYIEAMWANYSPFASE